MKEPVDSPSTYGETGYYNRSGGFHRNTDWQAYTGILAFSFRLLRDRWRHRRCDTTDFHHSFGCTLDPVVRKLDEEERWTRIMSPWQ